MRTKRSVHVTLTAAFAALYAVGVIFLAPISFQVFQVRIADALLPLSILFGWPVILGVSLGALVANFFGGLGPIDMVGGAVANFVATFLAWQVARRRSKPWMLAGACVEIIVVTTIVGTYLSYLFGIPIEAGWTGVLLGSIIAIGILGSLLLGALSTQRVKALLRAHNLDSES